MSKNILNIINNSDGTRSEINIPDGGGSPLIVQAQPNSSYEVKDLTKNLAPDMIKVTRKGDDLEIKILNETESEDDDSTVIVKDYYENDEGQIFGVAEDGNLYAYSPQELDSTMLAENLNDGLSSYQVLNTESDGGFLPILLGVLGAGALAGAGGGGGGGGGQASAVETNTAPEVEVTVTLSPTEGTVSEGDQVATSVGSDEDGDTLTYSLTTNPGGVYAIDSATGEVTLTQAGANLVNSGGDLPPVEVTATDPFGATGSDSDTPASTIDVDDGLSIDTVATITPTEDTVAAGDVVGTTTGSDVDGGTITYSIDDTTNYAIDPVTGEVTLTQAGADLVNAGEDLPTYTVSGVSTSGNTGSDSDTPASTIDVDDGLSIDTVATITPTEDTVAAGDVVGTTTGSDVDGGTITYSIDDTTNYAIDPVTGEVTLTQAGADLVNAGEDLPTYTVSGVSTSGNTGSDSDTPASTIDVDDGLSIDTVATITPTEDTVAAGDVVGTTTGSDVDGGTITYSIDDTTNYAIDPVTGEVTLTQAGADLVNAGEDLPTYTVSGVSTSGNTGSDSDTPASTIDVDDGLSIDTVATITPTEDTVAAGDVVGTTTGSDVDGGTITYSIDDTTNYAIDPVTGEVTLTQAGADLVNAGEDLPTYTVSGVSTSGNTGSDSDTPASTIDVDDGLSIDTVATITPTEDTVAAGDVVGTTTGSDVDGGTITYSIDDTTNYAIDPVTGEVTLTQAGADLVNAGEDLPTYTVSGVSTSGNTGSDSDTPASTIDVDDGLSIDTVATITPTEDTVAAGDVVGTTTGSDVDGGTITYSIDDTTNYAIDPVTGEVTLTQAGADLVNAGEDLPTYTVSGVSTSGNTGSDSDTPASTIDVDDGLSIDTVATITPTEDTVAAGDVVGTTTGSDVDGGTITYSIDDTTNYAIDPVTGEVTLTQAGADLVNAGEDLPTYTVSGVSTSGNTGSDSDTPASTIDVDDGLSIDTVATITPTEDTVAAGDVVGTTTGSDVDGGTITYSIDDTTNYAIDPVTGEVTLTQAGADLVNAGEDLPTYTVSGVSTSGNTGSDSDTPASTIDVDDGLSIDTVATITPTEDTVAAGDVVGTTTGSDVDGGTITYSIDDTTNYAIDPVTGEVTLTQAGADLVNAGEDLPTYTVSGVSTSGNTGSDSDTPASTIDVDDGLSIDTVATITPTEDTVAAGDVVGTTTGSDVDGGTITYSIDDTTNYAIDPVTGEVTLTQAGADLVNAGEDLPTYTVSGVSTSGNTGSDSDTPASTIDVDDGLSIDTVATITPTEDTVAAGDVVGTTTGSDVDGGTITYSIDDTTNYAIDPVTGEVTLTQAGADLVNAGEDLPTYTVSGVSTSGNTGSDSDTPASTIDVDDGLSIDTVATITPTEDTVAAGDVVGTTTGSDVDGGTITYSIDDTTNYAIDPVTGEVTLTQAGADLVNAGEDLPTYTVSGVSTSGNTGSDSDTPASTIDVDDGLSIDTVATITPTEDTVAAGDVVGTTTGSDVDGGTITYSIDDTTNYAIDPVTGEVTLTQAGADLVNAGEDLPTYTVSGVSTSGNTGSDSDTPASTIDVDDGLSIDTVATITPTEDTVAAGDVVGTTTGSDVDGGTITYSIDDTTNYAIDPVTGEVTLTQAGADLVNAGEDLPTYTVSGVSTSGNTGSDSDTPASTIDVDDGLSIDTVATITPTEDTVAAGDVVGTTTGSDVDGGTITYSIDDTTNYAIDPVTGEVTLTQAGADLVNAGEDLPTYTVSGVSTSGNTGSDSDTPASTIDVDDGLSIDTVATITPTEDTVAAGDVVGTTTGSDVDGGTITYSIDDTTNYAIDPVTGEVTLTQAGADLVNAGEDLPTYTVSGVSTSGNTGSDSDTPASTIDVDDGLSIDTVATITPTEDTVAAGDVVGTTTGSDVDGGTITYSIDDTTNYAIDPVTGEVTLTQAGADLVNAGEDLPTYTVSGVSTSGNTGSDSDTPASTIDVDDGLSIDTVATITPTEDTVAAGDVVGTTTGSDVDGGTITYSIDDTTNYAIDPVTGEVTLTQAGADLVNAGEDLPTYTVSGVSTSGNTGSDSDTPASTIDVDDGLSIDTVATITPTEDTVAAGDVVGTTTGSDVDGGTITYSIDDTTNYAIDPVTGEVTLTQAGADLVNAGEDLPTYTVSGVSTSGNTGSDSDTPASTIDVDDGLSIDTVATITPTEDTVAAGDVVGTTTGSDVDGGTITYSIDDTTNYAIDPVTGEVTLTQAGADLVNAGEDLPTYTVSGVSTSGNTGSDSDTPASTIDVDDGLSIDTVATITPTEDTVAAGDVVGTTTGSDVDGGTITYSIDDTTNYAIDPVTGEVTLTQAGADLVNAGEDLPTYTVSGVSTSGNTGSDSDTPASTIDVDDGLSIDTVATITPTEDTVAAGDVVGTTTGSDVDGGTITYSIDDTTNYAIDPVTGEVTLTQAGADLVNAGEDLPTYTVSGVSTSGNTGSDSDTPASTIDVDDGLSIDTVATITPTEDTVAAGDVVGTTTGSDVDGGTITYSIDDTTNYAIDPVTGEVTLTQAGADLVNAGEDLPTYTVSGVSTSGNTGSDSDTPASTIDVDDGLSIDTVATITPTEDTVAAGDVVGTTTGSDVDGGTITYSIDDTTNYAIDPVTGEVTLTQAGADLVNAGEDLPTYTVSGVSTSGNTGSDSDTPASTIDVDDGLSIDTVATITPTEDTVAAGDVVGTTTGSDVDGGTITYSIDDTTNYAIDPVTGEVTLTQAGADLVNAGEDLPTYTVSGVSTSGNTGSDSDTPASTIDVDDGLSIDTVATITPTEDTVAAGDVVGTTTGSDVDGGTITYSIDDTTNYAIDPVTGEVTLTQAGADLVNAGEDLPTYTVSGVSTSGNTGSDSDTPASTIDVDDGLSIDTVATITPTEDTVAAGDVVGTTTGSDVDGGTITYSIDDTTNYAIDPVTGEVTLTQAGADLVNAGEDLPTYTVSGVSTSGNTGSDSDTPASTIDVDDGLSIDTVATITPTEDTVAAGDVVGTTTGSDVDGGTITYSIDDTTNYAIDPVTGEVTLTQAGADLVNAGEDLPTYTVSGVSTSGNTGSDSDTPASTIDVDDGLSIDTVATITPTEDTVAAGDVVGTTTGSDVDGGTITYSIDDTTNYAIDPVTGEVTLTQAGADLVNAGEDLPTYTVSGVSTSGNTGSDSDTPASTIDVDDGLSIDTVATITPTEDTVAAGDVVGTTTGSDVDGGTITYSIDDTTNYAIDPVTGEVTLTQAGADLVNAGEDLPTYTVSGVSTSGNTGSDSDTPASTIDVDDGLSIDTVATITPTEDTVAAGDVVGTTTGSDVDGGTITYSIDDTTNYAIDPVTGEVTLTQAGADLVNAGEDLPTYTVSGVSTSGNTGSDSDTPASTIDVDDGLSIDTVATITPTEDTVAAGDVVGTTTGSDVDGGTITYSIDDTTNYAIDPVTGEVTLTQAGADLVNAGEDLPTYTVSGVSTSGNTGSDSDTPASTIDVDDGLSIDTVATITPTEDTVAAGDVVGTTTGSDVDGGTITYSIDDTTNYAIDPVTGEVTLTQAGADLVNAGEDLPTYTVSGVSTSGNTGSDSDTPASTIDVDDGLSIDTVATITPTEDTVAAGDVVGTTTGSDVDGGTITYSIDDTTNYAIDPVTGEVTLTQAGADLVNAGEDLPTYTVSGVSTSGNTGSDSDTPASTIDVDDGLSIDTVATITPTEDTVAAGDVVGTTTGSDVDGGTITYSIDDTTNYAIDPVTGEVTLTQAGADLVNAGEDLPTYTVSGVSTSGNTGSDSDTPASTIDVDDGLSIDTVATITPTEDTVAAGDVVGTTTGSDVDGGTITYSIDDTTNYAIDPVTGEVTLTQAGADLVNAGEDLPTYTVSGVSTSGNTGSDSDTPASTIDVDDGLSIDTVATITPTEDTVAAGDVVGTTTGSDVDGGTITYSIDDTTNYAIDPVTGEVTLTQAGADLVNAGEDLPTYTVSGVSTSGNTGSDSDTPASTIDVDDGLSIDTVATITPTEDTVAAGDVVGTTTGSDVDGGTITYSIDDTTNYAIDPVTGEVTLTQAGADLVNAGEDLPTYTVSGVSTSGNTGSDSDTPASTIDVDDGLSIDTVATITPTEDTVAAGDVVGTTTGSDVDGGTITYSIDDTTNYAIDPVTGEVTLTQAGADLVNAGEDLPTYTVSGVSTSGNTGSDSDTPASTIDVDDGLSIDTVATITPTEDTVAAGDVVGTTTGSDVDGGTITYSIDDTTNYAIDPVTGEVTLTQAGADLVNAGEDLPTYTVSGVSTSGNTGSDSDTPASTIDVDDGLSIDTVATITPTEDTVAAGDVVGTTTGSDVDGGTITYSIDDTTNYAIDPVTGEVTLTQAGADLVNAGEDLPTYTVSGVSTSGNTGSDSDTPASTIDVDDGLSIDTVATITPTEDTVAAGDVVGTTTGSDVDGGTITYSIDDTTNYAIDPVTGEVTLTQAGADLVNAGEDLPTYTVSGVSTSGNTGSDSDTPASTIDVDDGLSIDTVATITPTEDTVAAGDVVGTTTGSDVDGGTITYSIDDTTNYAIDPVTGEVTLTQAGADLVNAGEDLPTYTVSGVSTSGNTGSDSDTPASTIDVDDGLSIDTVATITPTEDTVAAGDVVGTTTGSDVDGGTITYSIDDTTNYAIDPVTGEVTLTQAGADLVNAGEDLPTYTVSGVSTSGNTGSDSDTPASTIDVDDGLSIDTVATITPTEDTVAAGDVVGTTTGSDVDGGTITYSIDDTTNYAIDPVTGEVTLTQAGADLVNAGEDLPTYTVSGVSTSGNTGSDSDTPASTIDVDDGLSIDTVATITPTEDTVAAGDVVGTTTGSDVDGGTITYSIDDTTNYAIDPVTGEVTLTQAGADLVNAGEDLPTYTVSGVSTSGNTGSDSDTPASTIDVDDGLSIDTVATITPTEDTVAAGDVVGTTTGSDVDGGTITYSIDDTTNYAIDPVTGEVTLTQAGADLVNAGEDLPTYTVSGVSTSGNTGSDSDTPASTIDVDDGLSIDTVATITPTEDTVAAGDVVGTTTGSDVDGGTITYSIDDTTNYAIDPVTGEVTLTQAGADLVNAGEDLPTYTVSGVSTSGNTGSDSDTPASTIDVDDGLSIDTVATITPTEDTVAAGDVVGTTTGSDVDGGTITYSIDDTTNYAIDPVTGEVTLTQAGADLVNAGEDLPTYTVSGVSTSGNTGSDSDTPASTIDVDDGLSIDTVATITPTEDTVAAGDVVGTTTGSDVDGGTITYSIDDTTNYAIDPVTGEVTLTQAGADLVNAGEDLPTYTVSGVSTSGNTGSDSDTPASTIDVDDGLSIDTVATITPTEDTVAAGDVVGTTTGSDVDGGTITYSIDDTTNYAIDPVTGEVTLTQAGADLVNAGEDLPTYTVSGVSTSGNTGSDSDTPASTIDVNDAPVASDYYVLITEDVPYTSQTSLLAYDTDEDGDTLSIVPGTYTTAQGGTIIVNSNGSYQYTPPANFNGDDTFEFTVTDGALSDTGTLNIHVAPINDAPVASDTSIVANEDVIYSGTLPVYSDVEGDSATYSVETNPSNGTVVINPDGTYTYTPSADYNGTDSFTYTVDDGNGGTNTYTVSVDVTAVNDAPTSTDDSITILEDMNNTTEVYTLSINDFGTYSDAEGDNLVFVRIDSLPTNGTLYLDGTAVPAGTVIEVVDITSGLLTFDPTDNSDADSSFTFSAHDGTDWSTTSYTTTVNITAVADAPIITIGEPDFTPNTFNANFEGSNGLSGWTTSGTVVVESNSLTNSNLGALTSIEGTQHVLLRAEGVANADIATALGVTAANLSAATTNNNATDGSYIQTQVYAKAGDVITVQYNFINAETQNFATGAYDDVAVAVVNGVITKLSDSSDIADDGLNYDNNNDIETTGWQTFTYVATADGYINLGFAIINAGDDTIDSYMMVDNVLINGQDPRLATFDLNLNVDLVDTDGSEYLTVIISDFPTGTTFSQGSLDVASGDWIITLAPGESLADIQATLPTGYDGGFNYNVTAITTDSNGDTATSVAYFADERYLAHAPTLTMDIDSGTYIADITYADNFDTNLDGWTGTDITRDNNAIRIDGGHNDTATKTFDFGVEYAGKSVTISFDTEISNWNDIGDDNMIVSVNGTQYLNLYRDDLDTNRGTMNSGSIHQEFTATVGSDGKVVVVIQNSSSLHSEDLWIDNFSITLPLDIYKYDIALDASLTDGSETLSDITLTNLPTGVTLQDSDGNAITQNGDGSYTVAVDGNGDAVVSIISPNPLTSTDTDAITSSVTSIDESGDMATTTICGSLDDSVTLYNINDSVDGGDGTDALVFGTDMILDFITLNSADNFSNIEVLDLTNAGVTLNNLGADDVLDITGNSSTTLKILGDSDDTVHLDGWATSGQTNQDGITYNVYTDTSGTSTQIWVQADVGHVVL